MSTQFERASIFALAGINLVLFCRVEPHNGGPAKWGEANRSGTTRLSEDVIMSVSGHCASARSRDRSAYLGNCRSRHSTIPEISL